MLQIKFNEELTEQYQRNNKTTGRKNIRCFPTCCPKGHEKNGFCGQAISVEISHTKPNVQYTLFGEFALKTKDNSVMPEILSDTGTISNVQAQAIVRNKANPLNPFIASVVDVCSDGIKAIFNKKLVGWHYGWLGTKTTCDDEHCFWIHVFEEKDDTLTFLRSFPSTPFLIFSRKRMVRSKFTKFVPYKNGKVTNSDKTNTDKVQKEIKVNQNSLLEVTKNKGKSLLGLTSPESSGESSIDDISVSSCDLGNDFNYVLSEDSTVNLTLKELYSIDFKVQILFKFIFSGQHLAWLPDKGANPLLPYHSGFASLNAEQKHKPSFSNASEMIGALDNFLLPGESEMISDQAYVKAFDHMHKFEEDNRNIVLDFVHFLFETRKIHDDITRFCQQCAQHDMTSVLLQQWNSNQETRESLMAFSREELFSAADNWVNTPKSFLISCVKRLKEIIAINCFNFFDNAGFPVLLLDLELDDSKFVKNPVNSPSYIPKLNFVDIVVRRLAAEAKPEMNEIKMKLQDFPGFQNKSPLELFSGHWSCVDDLTQFKEKEVANFASNTRMPHGNPMLQKIMPKLYREINMHVIGKSFLYEGERFLMAYPRRVLLLDGVERPFMWSTPIILEDFCLHFYRAWPSFCKTGPIINHLIYLLDNHAKDQPAKYRLHKQFVILDSLRLISRTTIYKFDEPEKPSEDLTFYTFDQTQNVVSVVDREFQLRASQSI